MTWFDPETNERIRRDVRAAMIRFLLRLLAFLAYCTAAAIGVRLLLEVSPPLGLVAFVAMVGLGAVVGWWVISSPDPWER